MMTQIQDYLDQGASKEPINPIWARFLWFPSYTKIRVTLYEHTGIIIIHQLGPNKFHLFLLLCKPRGGLTTTVLVSSLNERPGSSPAGEVGCASLHLVV